MCGCGHNNCGCSGCCNSNWSNNNWGSNCGCPHWGHSHWNSNFNDCGCSHIVTSPCTQSVGCLSTNFAKCITYSGLTLTGCIPLVNGEDLDVTLNRIVSAVCNLTPLDLGWNLFNYSCLNGSVPYPTGQAFAEGISAEFCALVTRVEAVEAPVFPICSLFTLSPYLITPGSTTLETILGYYATILCDLSLNSPSGITLANMCLPALTTETTLEDYLQYIINGVCTVRTALLALITANTNAITAIQAYVGPASTIASGHDNTDCLAGGATDTAYDTIQLIKTKLCSLNALVATFPNLSAVALTWASCTFGNTPATVSYPNTAQPLTTQLGRIVSVLKLLNYQFDSSFVITPSACGGTVSLSGAVGFVCSDLNTCSIGSLADVVDSGYMNGGSLTYSTVGLEFRPIRQTFVTTATLQPLSATVPLPRGLYATTALTPTIGGDTADLSTTVNISFRENTWLPLGSPTNISAGNAAVMKTWDGQIKFRGVFTSLASGPNTAYGGIGQPLNMISGLPIFVITTPLLYAPTNITRVQVLIRYFASIGSDFYANGYMEVDNTTTGAINLFVTSSALPIPTPTEAQSDFLIAHIQGSPLGIPGQIAYDGSFDVDLGGVVINY